MSFVVEGYKKLAPQATVTVLTGGADQINTVDNPFNVMPVVSTIAVKGKKVEVVLKPFSFTVIKVGIKINLISYQTLSGKHIVYKI